MHARDTDLSCAAELGERECASEFVKRGLGGVILRGRGWFQLPPARRVVQRWYCLTTLHTTVEPRWVQGGLAAISVATRLLPRRCLPECEADP